MRALVFALFALVAGCGSNDTTTPIPADMSVRADLAGSPASCGVDGVMLSCSGVSGGAGCYICSFANGAGSCAKPCTLLAPSCPTGQTCHELTVADAGAPVATEGNCTYYGYCR